MVDPDPQIDEEQLEEEQGIRQAAITNLLRQISNGLASYRLYPGDWEQPAFVAAVDRVRTAADEALAMGTIVLEIQGDRFYTSEGPLPADDSLVRLALACYERRMNILRVRAAPEPYEMAAFYEVLATRRDQIESPQQVEETLRDARVVSIALGKVELMPVEKALGDQLTAEQAEFWEVLERGEGLEVGDSAEDADVIYGRFRELVGALPSEITEDPDLYRRMQGLVGTLPKETRKALAHQLLDQMENEPVAERIVNTMTDADLARTIADMSSEDEEAIATASNLVASGFRRRDLVDLTAAIINGQQDAGTIMTGGSGEGLAPPTPTEEAEGDEDEEVEVAEELLEQREEVFETVTDIMGQRLKDTEHEDAVSIRGDFPMSFEHLQEMGEATFQDYLALEEDMERLDNCLDVWAQEVREALTNREIDRAARLVTAAENARKRTADDVEREELFLAYRRRVLDIQLLSSLVGAGGHTQAFTSLLGTFGNAGVEAMMDVLAEEQDRSRRAALISTISEMAQEYLPVIEERIKDDRWYVTRNAVLILRQAGGGKEYHATFEKAAKHPHPAVRREALRGLLVSAGPDALRYLRRMMVDSDPGVRNLAVSTLGGLGDRSAMAALGDLARTSKDVDMRKRAIEELSNSPSPDSLKQLQRLGSFNSTPRLPRQLRRIAKQRFKRMKGTV